MPLSAGDKLGPYEILAPIGKGGMGEVWKARDTRLGRIVAIKRLNAQHGARFERFVSQEDAVRARGLEKNSITGRTVRATSFTARAHRSARI